MNLLDEGLCTIAQASEFLALSRASVWKLMADGQLPWTRVGAAGRRIPRVALKTYAAKRLVMVAYP